MVLCTPCLAGVSVSTSWRHVGISNRPAPGELPTCCTDAPKRLSCCGCYCFHLCCCPCYALLLPPLLLQVNRRQAQADAVAADYAALQQDHVSLENELLEARSQVQLLQAEVRGGRLL